MEKSEVIKRIKDLISLHGNEVKMSYTEFGWGFNFISAEIMENGHVYFFAKRNCYDAENIPVERLEKIEKHLLRNL